MKAAMQISLRPGEKLYVNGAVLRVNRKVSIEFMNDVTFLLESHVTQPEDATTPLRQLYLIIQTMMIEPAHGENARRHFAHSYARLMASCEDDRITAALVCVKELIDRGRLFESLKTLRTVYPIEHEILSHAAKGSKTLSDQRLTATVAN
jgi:flagellar biosynthesis repressor protein FlbT